MWTMVPLKSMRDKRIKRIKFSGCISLKRLPKESVKKIRGYTLLVLNMLDCKDETRNSANKLFIIDCYSAYNSYLGKRGYICIKISAPDNCGSYRNCRK